MDKRIDSIEIIKDMDNNPDTSFLGEYSDEFHNSAIVRKYGKYWHEMTKAEKANFPEKGREYRFFIPYACGLLPTDKNYNRYGKRDYKRMEALNNGFWSFLIVGLKARVYINGICQNITSGFIGGIESDSKPAYIRQIIREQKAELIEQLKSIGFSMYAIKQALKDIQEKD